MLVGAHVVGIALATVTDEHTREALATLAARRMGADDTVSAPERIVEAERVKRRSCRCDNGPELISQSLRRSNHADTGYICHFDRRAIRRAT